MDKEEAERLARAIRKAPVAWIQVQAIACKPVTHTHELKCAYRQERKGLFHPQETWTTLWITSPRQWIDLLTKHRDDLELP
jgi:hypothetical protein